MFFFPAEQELASIKPFFTRNDRIMIHGSTSRFSNELYALASQTEARYLASFPSVHSQSGRALELEISSIDECASAIASDSLAAAPIVPLRFVLSTYQNQFC